NEDIISYFEGLGIKLKEEDHGRMFPVSNKAQSVVDALISELHRLRVTIRTNTAVKRVHYENNTVKEVVLQNGEAIQTKSVVIAVGGKS
ncbi:NAD(P)/FAD-dependent oxidoreductase, partial [Escherichia coli]|nr:NAD(P)/FAD-dependent oxidoreductase [Escherichia coli]